MTDLSSDRRINALSGAVIDAAMTVHRELGPGLLERVYERCLAIELQQRRIAFVRQREVPIVYKGIPIEAPLRLDFIIDDSIIIEIKTVEKLIPLFEAQIPTYLRLTRIRLGLLINFNTPVLKDGIRRIAH